MDSKHILIKLITLLYGENVCDLITRRSTDLALDIVKHLKLPTGVTDSDLNRTVIVSLKETVHWMVEEPEDSKYDFDMLSQRIRLNVSDDYSTWQSWEDVKTIGEKTDEEIMEICASLERELKANLQKIAIENIIHKAHRDIFYSGSSKRIDIRQYINNLVADLETYSGGWTDDHQAFVLNLMHMSDPDSVKRVIERAKEDTNGTSGGFKSGYQALNRMLGQSQDFRRGMFVVIGALTHHYKSGLAQDIFRHMCIYNKPHVEEGNTKKPLLLYFSGENRAEEDIMRMYITLLENETGRPVDTSMVDPEEASQYISKRLSENGFDVAMCRIDPGSFSHHDLFATVLKYEDMGYEIHGIVFDYLEIINTDSLKSSMGGEDVRALFQVVRTFMSSRNILFITPHQLSQDAANLKRQGVTNFTSELVGKNYWDKSKRIANEIDLEIFINIEKRDGKFWLAVQRGKHRTVKPTPSEYLQFYLPFTETLSLGIEDDLHKEDSSVNSLLDIGGSGISFDD